VSDAKGNEWLSIMFGGMSKPICGWVYPAPVSPVLRLIALAFICVHIALPSNAACVPMAGLKVCPGWNGQLATPDLVEHFALLDERADNITRSLLKGNTEAKLCGSSTSACCQTVRKIACGGAVKMLFRELGGGRATCPMEDTAILHETCIGGVYRS
jgi:hypothetical protein